MTEERSCETCGLSSYNNVDEKGCEARGVSDCVHHSKWQPIHKAPSFQMTEEEARILFIDLGISESVEIAIEDARRHGYIRKSSLVELVEEAEWIYENYQSAKYCLTTDEALEKNHDALQALKKDHPDFGGKK